MTTLFREYETAAAQQFSVAPPASTEPAGGPICPSCGLGKTKPFYDAGLAPVHSVQLMRTREEAVAIACGRLVLHLCDVCGFISNPHYDPTLQDYSLDYEETQGFSDTFNSFHTELAEGLVRDYDLRGKTVLEIGCGKGEFLALLCELGDNRGIGFDPAFDPARNPENERGRIRFIQDYYSEAYAGVEADLIVCKMTLEHISETGELLQTLRKSLQDQPETVLFFQVPDMTRILRDGAFWDVYYEHCSYFTATSLRNLFRRSGFEVLKLDSVYDGQYLTIEAVPGSSEPANLCLKEDESTVLRSLIAQFGRESSRRLQSWKHRLSAAAAQGERVVLWGGGSKAVAFLTAMGEAAGTIRFAVDINPFKHGTSLPGTGQLVVAPQHLKVYRPDLVIAMNPVYRREIRASLDAMGIDAPLMALE